MEWSSGGSITLEWEEVYRAFTDQILVHSGVVLRCQETQNLSGACVSSGALRIEIAAADLYRAQERSSKVCLRRNRQRTSKRKQKTRPLLSRRKQVPNAPRDVRTRH